MKERPILFNGDMVRRIFDGSKTQTRRVVDRGQKLGIDSWAHHAEPMLPKWGNDFPGADGGSWILQSKPGPLLDMEWQPVGCPFGQPGDRLWVRETWIPSLHSDGYNQDGSENVHDCAGYKADMKYRCGKPINKVTGWTPSIHMPRWASRITLEVVSVRVERLQDISEEDARAEGCTGTSLGPYVSADELETAKDHFRRLWGDIYGTWEQNPWVWVVEFKRV